MSAETLKAATLTLLDTGMGWTKGANARLADNSPCSPLHPDALVFDMMGALIRAQFESDEPDFSSFHAVYNELRSNIPVDYKNEDIESFNDDALWADVEALFL